MKGSSLRGKPLYLDMQARGAAGAGSAGVAPHALTRAAHQATTPVDPRVLDAMMPYFVEQYGNPHSRTHLYGWQSEEAVERARRSVADLIGADAKEIIFTSARAGRVRGVC